MPPRFFLLSPARCTGARARMLLSPRAQFPLARQIRSAAGAPLGEIFSFLSGLYFRGKLTYALTFGRAAVDSGRRPSGSPEVRKSGSRSTPTPGRPDSRTPGLLFPVLVITPSLGLQPPDYPVTVELLEQFAQVQIDTANRAYTEPLEASVVALDEAAGTEAQVVLLGSIATGKYVDLLTRTFGDRLLFPAEFVGRGDMSRGGLLLRCVTAGLELTYIPVEGAVRHGARPAKLEPLRRTRRGDS